MSLDEILYKLLGPIQPMADTTLDGERLCNIENYNDALYFLIKELLEASKWKDDNRKSAKDIGKECNQILLDLKETLKEVED